MGALQVYLHCRRKLDVLIRVERDSENLDYFDVQFGGDFDLYLSPEGIRELQRVLKDAELELKVKLEKEAKECQTQVT